MKVWIAALVLMSAVSGAVQAASCTTFKEKVNHAKDYRGKEFKEQTGYDMPLTVDWKSLDVHCENYVDDGAAIVRAQQYSENMIEALIGVYKTGSKIDQDIIGRMKKNFKGLTIQAGKVAQTEFVIAKGKATLTFPIEAKKKWDVSDEGWIRSLYDAAPKKND